MTFKRLPDAIIANPLGAASKEQDHALAKAGDVYAAARLAKKLITDELISALKEKTPFNAIMVAVNSIEESGKNALPIAAAKLIADRLKIEVDNQIVQSTQPKRTNLNGLDRIFSSPEFEGEVKSGRSYVLLDDTITQGRTFISLAQHIEKGGAQVVSMIALTGKQYSSKITPEKEQIEQVRKLYGDIEHEFKQATGYNFGKLTASEARYLATFKEVDRARDRIVAQAHARTDSDFGEVIQADRVSAVGDSLLHQAQTAEREQRALLAQTSPTSAVEAYETQKKLYIEAKHQQVERIEDKLRGLIRTQQTKIQQLQTNSPRWLARPSAKRAFQTQLSQQQSRLQTIEQRLSGVLAIKTRTNPHAPTVEALAAQKLRREQPELIRSRDAELAAKRLRELKAQDEQREKQRQEQAQQRQARGLSQRLKQ